MNETVTLDDGSTLVYASDGGYSQIMPDGSIYSSDANGVLSAIDSNGDAISAAAYTPPLVSGGFTSSDLGTLTNDALKVLSTISAFKTALSPAPRTAASYAIGGGATSKPNADGTITTRLPSGKIATSPMPAGTPFVFPNGDTIVNNGDGSYSTIHQDGSVTTRKYSAIGGGGAGVLVLIGIGLLVLIK